MKIRHHKRAASAVLALAVAASVGFAVSAQGVTVDHDVRQADFTTGVDDGFANSATRATGHFDFLKEGIRLYTSDSANPGSSLNKVAEYFPIDKPLAGVINVEYDWYGTSPSPGIQYVMDFDNDGEQDGMLVGEKVYGGQDVWLTGASKAEYKGTGAPSNTGGSGTSDHGTLAEWSGMYPNAKILFGGFSLGSGVLGDGVLRSISYGDDRYVFTDLEPAEEPTPEPTVNPAGTVLRSVNGRTILFQLKTAAIPEGSKAGTLPVFRVTSTDSTVTVQTPAPGTTGYYANTCPRKVTCTYKAYRNNVLVSQYTIRK